MRFLLDTDHISVLQKQSGHEYAALMVRIAQVPRADLAFCIVSFHEQVLGCNVYIAQAKSPADINRRISIFDATGPITLFLVLDRSDRREI
jgi:tRNA(fMet)-specific endonuclease VapC